NKNNTIDETQTLSVAKFLGRRLFLQVLRRDTFLLRRSYNLERFLIQNQSLHNQRNYLHMVTPSHYHEQTRSEEHTSELQSRFDLVCRLLLEIQTSSLT